MIHKNFRNWYKLAIQAEEMFDITTTDMPYYDNMLRNPNYFKKQKGKTFEITYMSPQDYYEKIATGFWEDPQTQKYFHNYNNYRTLGLEKRLMPSNLKKIDQYITSGNKVPMPVIEYDNEGMYAQEGHHRVRLAEIKGIQKIPVMIVQPCEETS